MVGRDERIRDPLTALLGPKSVSRPTCLSVYLCPNCCQLHESPHLSIPIAAGVIQALGHLPLVFCAQAFWCTQFCSTNCICQCRNLT